MVSVDTNPTQREPLKSLEMRTPLGGSGDDEEIDLVCMEAGLVSSSSYISADVNLVHSPLRHAKESSNLVVEQKKSRSYLVFQYRSSRKPQTRNAQRRTAVAYLYSNRLFVGFGY